MNWFSTDDPVTMWTYYAPTLVNDTELSDTFFFEGAQDDFNALFGLDPVTLGGVYDNLAAAQAADPGERPQPQV